MEGEGISDGLSTERKVEIRVKNGRKVIVEKSAAEGLPEGWIKKLVISNKSGRKNRRDPFFIDPKSEYIFPSFKSASRYVETGDVGHYARKFKESDIEDDDSGHSKRVLLVESAEALLEKEMKDVKDPIEKQPIAKRVTRSQTKASKTEEDVDVKSRLRSVSSQSPEKKSVVKEEDARESTENYITRSKAIVKTNELANSVARRASKRLAGIELEPTPELNTRAKAQRVVPADDDDGTAGKCKQPVNPAVATSEVKKMDILLIKEVAKSYNTEVSSPKPNAAASTRTNRGSGELEMQIEKSSKPVSRSGSGDKKKMKMPLMTYEAELNPVFRLDGYKEKEEMSPVSPLSRKTSATKREKTAAGKRLGRSSPKAANKVTSPKVTDISLLRPSKKGEHPHPYDNGNATQRRNELSNNSFVSSVVRGTCSDMMEMNNTSSAAFDTTLADLWKDPCIAFAIKTLTGDTLCLPNSTTSISCAPNNNHAMQKGVTFSTETPQNANTYCGEPGVSRETTGMNIWKDPCVDFAIKTLTGAIPIGLDEPVAKPKSEEGMMTMTTSGRQSSSSDYLVQQCSNNMGKPGDLRFPQSFSKD